LDLGNITCKHILAKALSIPWEIREKPVHSTKIQAQATINPKMVSLMREPLNGSTLKVPTAIMMAPLSIQMTLDQANTTCLLILGRDPNTQWEIRERLDLQIITRVPLIIILRMV
jgi:hypothetical protein